jgi:hypothetical protein
MPDDEKKQPVKKPYVKPELVFLGTIADLTAGHGGSVADGMGNSSRAPRRGPVRPQR